MLFTHTKELADVIVETLATGSFDGATLLSKIQKLKKTTSKETFYRVLRKLLANEVVIKNKRMYVLNSRWLELLYELSKPRASIETLGNGREFRSKTGTRLLTTLKTRNQCITIGHISLMQYIKPMTIQFQF